MSITIEKDFEKFALNLKLLFKRVECVVHDCRRVVRDTEPE